MCQIPIVNSRVSYVSPCQACDMILLALGRFDEPKELKLRHGTCKTCLQLNSHLSLIVRTFADNSGKSLVHAQSTSYAGRGAMRTYGQPVVEVDELAPFKMEMVRNA